MSQFFQFEADFVESLRCIPMQVRLKLDTCGVKLKLAQWNHLNPMDRQALVELPCDRPEDIQDYHDFLHRLVVERTGTIATDLPIDSAPDWLNSTAIPPSVLDKAEELEVEITVEKWVSLTPLQRFALIKLSRSGHENSNFLPALREFHLL